MGFLWDIVVIASIMVWVLALYLQGYIPTWLVLVALVGLVLVRALGRGAGGGVGRLVRTILTVGLPIASILTFAIIYGGGSNRDMTLIFSQVGVLLVILAGLYFMFRGLFSRR
jgi:hypothetical protein